MFLGAAQADLSIGFLIIPLLFYLIPAIIALTILSWGGLYSFKLKSTKKLAFVKNLSKMDRL